MNWRHVQDLLYMVLFVNWKCCICYATQETFNFQSTENVFQNVFRRLKDMKYISFAHFRNPNSSPVSGCHRSPPWLLINLIVSEQGGTVPPWLWCPDRTDLSSSDHQAEKKSLLLTVWIRLIQLQPRGMHVKCWQCDIVCVWCGNHCHHKFYVIPPLEIYSQVIKWAHVNVNLAPQK